MWSIFISEIIKNKNKITNYRRRTDCSNGVNGTRRMKIKIIIMTCEANNSIGRDQPTNGTERTRVMVELFKCAHSLSSLYSSVCVASIQFMACRKKIKLMGSQILPIFRFRLPKAGPFESTAAHNVPVDSFLLLFCTFFYIFGHGP